MATQIQDIEYNKTYLLCELLDLHFSDIYDDIYIPYKYFKKNDWDIEKVLIDNKDSLFYSEEYMTDTDKDRFEIIFNKYVNLVKEIFVPDTDLYQYLKRWTYENDDSWYIDKSDPDIYLRSLIKFNRYKIISPHYIINVYHKFKSENPNHKIYSANIKNHLNKIINIFKSDLSNFIVSYNSIVDNYVYEQPLDNSEREIWSKGLINATILLILDLYEKSLSLNIFGIHQIVSNIIEYYTPIDFINCHIPELCDNKNINIV